MLYAKFTPGISFNQSKDPFTPQNITLEFMTATAVGYQLGATSTRFNVYFGTATIDGNGKISEFSRRVVKLIDVSGSVLDNWGTDDTTILNYLAGEFNLTVSQYYED
jgi:hypothetical protein